MKTLIIFALMAFAAADDDNYELESLHMPDLAKNLEEFKKFSDCLVNKGPCSELHQRYKALTPEMVKNGCKKCSAEIKQNGNTYFETVKTNFPEHYDLFKQIYDPENKYLEALEIEFKKYKNV